MVDSGKPYKDIEIKGNGFLRVFDDDIDPIELLWYRDKEDRTVEILHDTDWKFQEDNKLPIELKKHTRIFIPKYSWHRLIKGTKNLKLRIIENG